MSGPRPGAARPGRRPAPGAQDQRGNQDQRGGRVPKGARPVQGQRPQQDRPQGPSRLRLFYALPLPETVAAELVKAQGSLTDNWRRVDPDQLHVTLAYLPGVPKERVAELQAAGRELTAEFPPLSLRLRGTGYHPNVGGPRVWFVKVEGEGLHELADRLKSELERRGFAPEGDFQPHVTLARKKGPAPRVPPRNFGMEWTAPSVELIHTFLPKDKTGPVHDPVSRFRLSGSALPEVSPPISPTTGTGIPGEQPDEERHG